MNTRKPKLGQNFLIDQNASLKIVEALGDISARTVIEIGPGKGAITSLLASRARRLIAIEYDNALARGLRQNLSARSNVEVIERDVLMVDFASVLGDDVPAVAVGNLPYYITSPILTHLFASHTLFSTLVLMVQREVADRIAAAPGTSDYGLLSATVQLYSEVQTLFTLPPIAFDPPPDVHSTVLRLNIRPRFAELAVEPTPFLAFLKAGFQQKRKTLANNLRAAGYGSVAISTSLAAAGIEPAARAEAVPLPQMASFYKDLALTPH